MLSRENSTQLYIIQRVIHEVMYVIFATPFKAGIDCRHMQKGVHPISPPTQFHQLR